LAAEHKILEPPRKKREGNKDSNSSDQGEILKTETLADRRLTAYLQWDTIVPDRFISSWVLAMRCKTWGFVSRGKAPAKKLLDISSKSPGAEISERRSHWTNPIQLYSSYIFPNL
jgi:hypothetical protein